MPERWYAIEIRSPKREWVVQADTPGDDGGVIIAENIASPGHAHLMAAGPEMLAALEAMLAHMDTRGRLTIHPDSPEYLHIKAMVERATP
jgi:hypothetical protein